MLLSRRQSDLCPPGKSPSVHTWGKNNVLQRSVTVGQCWWVNEHMTWASYSMQSIIHAWPPFCVFLCVPHLSSSSSMKPLPSTSRTLKTLLTFSAVMAFNPTISKNFLGSNVSATNGKTESIDRCKHLPKCLPEIYQLFNNCGFKLVAQTVCNILVWTKKKFKFVCIYCICQYPKLTFGTCVCLFLLRIPHALGDCYGPAKASRAFLISSAFNRSVIDILSAGEREREGEDRGQKKVQIWKWKNTILNSSVQTTARAELQTVEGLIQKLTAKSDLLRVDLIWELDGC